MSFTKKSLRPMTISHPFLPRGRLLQNELALGLPVLSQNRTDSAAQNKLNTQNTQHTCSTCHQDIDNNFPSHFCLKNLPSSNKPKQHYQVITRSDITISRLNKNTLTQTTKTFVVSLIFPVPRTFFPLNLRKAFFSPRILNTHNKAESTTFQMTSTPPAQYSNISIPQEQQQQQEQYHPSNYHNHRQHYQQHYSMLEQNKEGTAATAEDRKINPAAATKEKRANHNTPLPTTTRKEIIIHKKLANIGHTTTTSVEKFQQTTTHHHHHHHHHSEHTTTSSSDNHNSGDEMQCSSSNNNSGSAEVSGAHTSGTMSTVTTITFEDIAKYFDLKLEGKLLSFFFHVFFVVSCCFMLKSLR